MKSRYIRRMLKKTAQFLRFAQSDIAQDPSSRDDKQTAEGCEDIRPMALLPGGKEGEGIHDSHIPQRGEFRQAGKPLGFR
jgi:hypothetical protein